MLFLDNNALSVFNFVMKYTNFLDYSVLWKSSDAIDRRGAVFAVSHLDAPGATLVENPHRVSIGTGTIVGIHKEEVL